MHSNVNRAEAKLTHWELQTENRITASASVNLQEAIWYTFSTFTKA